MISKIFLTESDDDILRRWKWEAAHEKEIKKDLSWPTQEWLKYKKEIMDWCRAKR